MVIMTLVMCQIMHQTYVPNQCLNNSQFVIAISSYLGFMLGFTSYTKL